MLRIQLYVVQLTSLLLVVLIGALTLARIESTSMERTQAYAQALLEQVAAGIELSSQDAVAITRGFAYSESVQRMLIGDDLLERTNSYRAASSTHHFIVSTNKIAMELALQLNDGKLYLFGPMFSHLIREEIFSRMSEEELLRKEGSFVFFDDKTNPQPVRRLAYVSPIYVSTVGELSGEQIGYCILLCDFDPFVEALYTAQNKEPSFVLTDAQGTTLVGKRYSEQGHENGMQMNLPTLGWNLWIGNYGEPSDAQNHEYRQFACMSIGLIVLVLVALSIVINQYFTKPARLMEREMTDIAHASGAQRLSVQMKNELGSIAQMVNQMLDRIDRANKESIQNQQRLFQVELSLNQMKLMALQSQINPHFLYNTLAGMRAMALEMGVPVIAKMATSMAALFRYSIKGDAYVRMDEEIDVTLKYLEIMNLRMDGKFEVDIRIPEELVHSYMVKMILQPVVENAIFHGLEGKDGKGLLSISGEFLDEKRYRLMVSDNGLGMEKETIDRLNEELNSPAEEKPGGENRSIGLSNINNKIKLLVGRSYGVSVCSRIGEGTTVTLILPFLHNIPS